MVTLRPHEREKYFDVIGHRNTVIGTIRHRNGRWKLRSSLITEPLPVKKEEDYWTDITLSILNHNGWKRSYIRRQANRIKRDNWGRVIGPFLLRRSQGYRTTTAFYGTNGIIVYFVCVFGHDNGVLCDFYRFKTIISRFLRLSDDNQHVIRLA